MTNHFVATLILVVFSTTIAELPWVEKHIIIPLTDDHPHLAVLAEGIVGSLLVWWSGKKTGFSGGEK